MKDLIEYKLNNYYIVLNQDKILKKNLIFKMENFQEKEVFGEVKKCKSKIHKTYYAIK